MAIITVSACQCDVCEHVWLKESAQMPACCPSRKCRSRLWNAEGRAAMLPIAALEDLRGALRVSPPHVVRVDPQSVLRSLEQQLKREPILDKSGDYTQE